MVYWPSGQFNHGFMCQRWYFGQQGNTIKVSDVTDGVSGQLNQGFRCHMWYIGHQGNTIMVSGVTGGILAVRAI